MKFPGFAPSDYAGMMTQHFCLNSNIYNLAIALEEISSGGI